MVTGCREGGSYLSLADTPLVCMVVCGESILHIRYSEVDLVDCEALVPYTLPFTYIMEKAKVSF